MKKFEYKSIFLNKSYEVEDNIKLMNDLGSKGWELVNVVEQGNNTDALIEHVAYFKREINDNFKQG